ncbi:hypothetical protein Ancab_026397 [Ancistrocladus abbreviatus]
MQDNCATQARIQGFHAHHMITWKDSKAFRKPLAGVTKARAVWTTQDACSGLALEPHRTRDWALTRPTCDA